MYKLAVKVAVWEYERGWGYKFDDYMVCQTVEDALAFKNEFNSKNDKEYAPDWYMKVEGEPMNIYLTEEQYKILIKNGRVWQKTLLK